MKDDNYLIGAARHLLQHCVEVNRATIMVYNKRRMNYRTHDCFLCFLRCSHPPALFSVPSPSPSSPPPPRLFLPVSPVTSRPSLQHQHRCKKVRLCTSRPLVYSHRPLYYVQLFILIQRNTAAMLRILPLEGYNFSFEKAKTPLRVMYSCT